ncbi:hypothetical protein G6F68_019842 [Rhizopus microsporus]|nr:hypothetical protein G6F68_019842 [Rhizopus microsporus]
MPLPTSPTTRKPFVSNSMRTARRSTGWSSTIKTVFMSGWAYLKKKPPAIGKTERVARSGASEDGEF